MKSKIVALSKNEDFKNLLKKKKISNKFATIFFGNINMSEEIPVSEIQWTSSSIQYKRYGNLSDYFEQVSFGGVFLVFCILNILHILVISNWLFTDVYGQHLH